MNAAVQAASTLRRKALQQLSRLTDQLAALGQTSRPTMGFGRAERPKHNAAMLLIAEATDSNARSRLPEAAPSVDAVVLGAEAGAPVPPATTLDVLKGKTWGVAGCIAAPESLDALKDAGCDFILVPGDDAPSTILRDDGMARGFTIQPGLSEERARALEDLPFEFLVLDAGDASWPISIAGLMRLQGTISMVAKHILLKVDHLPPPDSLALLRDMPVSGLLIDLSAVDGTALADQRKALDDLEPRRPRQPMEQTPTLTALPGVTAPASSDGGGDEDWDDGVGDHAGISPPQRPPAVSADSRGLPWIASR